MIVRRKYRLIFLGAILLAAAFAQPLFAQAQEILPPDEPYLKLVANHQEIRVGDDVEITREVGYPTDYNIEGTLSYPEINGLNQLGIDMSEFHVTNRFRTESVTRQFQALKAGKYTVEPVKVRFRGPDGAVKTVESNGLVIVVLEGDAPQEGLRDIKGLKPIKSPVDWLLMLTIAAIALGIILIVLVIFARISRPSLPGTPIHTRSLEDEFITKLEGIDIPEEYDTEGVKGVYVLMSDLVRTYLDKRWNIDAREATTREVLDMLREKKFDLSALDRYEEMARAFDMVKYAKGRPYKIDIENAREAAIAFIRHLGAGR